MQTYLKDWYRTRGITIGEESLPCEVCVYNLIQGALEGVNIVNNIHHILSSSRGKRKHNKDGSDIIGLCLYHHDHYHDGNDWTNRQLLLDIVQYIMPVYKRLGHKEKLRRFVELISNNIKKQYYT